MTDTTEAPSAATTPTAVEVLKDALKSGVSLTRIPPLCVTFDVKEASSDAAATPVEVMVTVNPVLAAAMEVMGATKTGARSWNVDATDPTQLEGLVESIYEGLWYPQDLVDALAPGKKITASVSRTKAVPSVASMLGVTYNGRSASHPNLCARVNGHPWCDVSVLIKKVRTRRHVKVVTDQLTVAGVDLDLLPTSGVKKPITLPAWRALELYTALENLGYMTQDVSTVSGALRSLASTLYKSISALSVPGSFGEVRLVVGAGSGGATGFRATDKRVLRSEVLTLGEALRVLSRSTKAGANVYVQDSVEELLLMESVTPKGRARLRAYQDLCVSLMLTTRTGILNAVAPGLGKTVITAVGLAEEAALKDAPHASLVIVPAGMRSQWKAELSEWHPSADVRTIESSKDVESALEDLATTKEPRIVVASYEMAVAAEKDIRAASWDVCVVDEAAVLRSTSSKRTQSLWRIRGSVPKAFALTGTPIDKSVDDLGRILAWVNNDAVFASDRLSKRHPDLSREVQREALRATLGPMVFRRDRSEIADELPSISTEVVRIDPTPAEKALAQAARRELKKIHDELEERIKAAEDLLPGDPRFAAARAELVKARGAVLGGVTLARMAATDPQAVADSDSAGATLLKASGLVDKAVKSGGTKRKQLVELTSDLVGRGEKVLLFSDFSSVAEHLADDLRKMGVSVGTIVGGQSHKSRHAAATGFMEGDYDALVLTAAAQEGLNLQAASVLVHVDLPWSPSAVVQRVGRASRIGSTSSHLSVLIPLMVDTVEERVASVLIPRAMVAMSALDSGRVDDVRNTELGVALAGLAETTTDAEADKSDLSILALAREVLHA